MKIPIVDLKNPKRTVSGRGQGVMLNGQEQQPVIPFSEPFIVPRSMKRLGDPDRLSIYRNEHGDGVFAVARWEPKGQEDSKVIRPFIWNGGEHISAGAPGPRPILHLPEIVAHENAIVLVVEGEKAAEDCGKYLPAGWIATTWCGGANAINHTDWLPIKTRRVVIWPDNDVPGRQAASDIQQILSKAAVVKVPQQWPEGWDLADSLPAGVMGTDITLMMHEALERASKPQDILPSSDPPVKATTDYRALGSDDNYYYAMPQGRAVIIKFTAREIMSAPGCMRLVNDIAKWEEDFPSRNSKSGGVDWNAAGSSVMAACEAAGYYDERRICGRGVWKDGNVFVANTGDMLVVNGHRTDPTKFISNESLIYKTSEALFIDGFNPMDEASDGEGRLIVELCNAPRWDKPVYGDLLAGYIATSVVCGGLDWRTHIWVTGNSGSGKSTVVNNIASACIGDMAIYPLGETTEAGIRQMIGQDARPVIFDEMEGTDQSRSNSGDARRQAIIQLMRMSSTTGKGRIMKGSAGHKATSFTMRSSFLVASIGVNLTEAPDLTRTMVLSLKPLSREAVPADREDAEWRWAEMNRLSARIPADLPHRLFARQVRLLPVLRKNIEMFREVIAEVLGNRRMGDQVGTLLAGRCSLTSDKLMTHAECREYVNRFDWNRIVAAPSEREDKALVRHLRQSMTRVMGNDGRVYDRSIGELIMCCLGGSIDVDISEAKAFGHLMRLGLSPSRGNGVWVAKGIDELTKLMRTSANATDWWSVISRYPSAEIKSKVRFAGVTSHAILIPEEEWVD